MIGRAAIPQCKGSPMARIAVTSLAKLVVALSLSGCHSLATQEGPLASNPSALARSSGRDESLPAAESAKLCLATAETMEQAEKYPEAIELYEKARKLDNHAAAQATRRLAVIHDRTGNFDKALDEYRRGLQENPKDAELINNFGYGYYCRGQWQAAEQQLRKAVSLDPKLACAWNNLGMCLAQQMRYEEGLAAFEKAVSKAHARCNLGFIQATQGKIAEARRSYESALKMEPGLQMARLALQKLGEPNPRSAAHAATSAAEDRTPLPLDSVQLPTKQ
jgi:Tfp pilus assembly protein PilF